MGDERSSSAETPQAAKACSVPGCDRTFLARGLCRLHYRRLRERGKVGPVGTTRKKRDQSRVCSVPGCERSDLAAHELCSMHYWRWRKTGDVGPAGKMIGSGSINPAGYRVLHRPQHPNAGKHGNILEHVVVMSEFLGRPLRKGETVHHKNGIRHQNDPDNLELWCKNHPSGQRVSDLIEWAIEFLKAYAADDAVWPEELESLRHLFAEAGSD